MTAMLTLRDISNAAVRVGGSRVHCMYYVEWDTCADSATSNGSEEGFTLRGSARTPPRGVMQSEVHFRLIGVRPCQIFPRRYSQEICGV